jgi:hypothetical protein
MPADRHLETALPHLTEPAAYLRGSCRIDYALLSPELLMSVATVGYEPFHYTTPTDHRGIYIDFYTDQLFGNSTNPLPAAQYRQLQSKYPDCRKTYITGAAAHGNANTLFSRLRLLLESKERDDVLIESLDTLLGEYCTVGESRCTKAQPTWWSRKVHKLRAWRRILQKLRSGFKNNKNFDDQIHNECLEAGLDLELLPTTLEATTLALTKVRQDIYTSEKDRKQLCKTEQAEQVSLERNLDNKNTAKIIDNIRKCEAKNEAYKMFKNIRGKQHQKAGLTTVDIPTSWPPSNRLDDPTEILADSKQWDKDDKPFRTLDLPEEIAMYLKARNQRHFGQAQGTSFTVAPLAELISWEADMETAELILKGEYTNAELDNITQLLLKHCASASPPDTIPPLLTLEDFIGKLRIWREQSSTSPSGRHLAKMTSGHYKAVCRPIAYACDPWEKDECEASRVDLLQAHLDIINYCLLHGYSLQSWHQVVNIMILKEPNNHKINRLRVLHLFEADYNLVLGVKWQQLM